MVQCIQQWTQDQKVWGLIPAVLLVLCRSVGLTSHFTLHCCTRPAVMGTCWNEIAECILLRDSKMFKREESFSTRGVTSQLC